MLKRLLRALKNEHRIDDHGATAPPDPWDGDTGGGCCVLLAFFIAAAYTLLR